MTHDDPADFSKTLSLSGVLQKCAAPNTLELTGLQQSSFFIGKAQKCTATRPPPPPHCCEQIATLVSMTHPPPLFFSMGLDICMQEDVGLFCCKQATQIPCFLHFPTQTEWCLMCSGKRVSMVVQVRTHGER